MSQNFNLNKIKFSTDPSTFKKAVDLYEDGKVKSFSKDAYGYSALVHGGEIYHVYVSAKDFERGDCDCYMGQKDYTCKHMVAVALCAVLGGKEIKTEDVSPIGELICNGKFGELNKEGLAEVKKEILVALRHIKSYNGPSRVWFAYQSSLDEGCRHLSFIFSKLPVSRQTAELVIKTILKLDDKLCRGGVDDSNGTVGGFIQESVELLKEFASLEQEIIDSFKLLCQKSTCFDWQDELVRMYDER